MTWNHLRAETTAFTGRPLRAKIGSSTPVKDCNRNAHARTRTSSGSSAHPGGQLVSIDTLCFSPSITDDRSGNGVYPATVSISMVKHKGGYPGDLQVQGGSTTNFFRNSLPRQQPVVSNQKHSCCRMLSHFRGHRMPRDISLAWLDYQIASDSIKTEFVARSFCIAQRGARPLYLSPQTSH